MRTHLLASLVGLSLVACAGQIDGGGGGDDDGIPETCGNNATDPGETCDDGNNADGDGCSAACQMEALPRLDVTVDKPTVETELGTTHMITVTLTGADSFGGPVTVTPSIVDAAQAPLTTWLIGAPQTVEVPQNGSASAIFSFSIPTENKGLNGTVKFTTTSTAGAGTHDASVAVTALNQVTLGVKLDVNGQCEYPTAGTVKMTTGTKVRFLNTGATGDFVIHMGGEPQGAPLPEGFDHQDDIPRNAPGVAYEQTLSATATVGRKAQWYCHSPGPTVGNLIIEAVAP